MSEVVKSFLHNFHADDVSLRDVTTSGRPPKSDYQTKTILVKNQRSSIQKIAMIFKIVKSVPTILIMLVALICCYDVIKKIRL